MKERREKSRIKYADNITYELSSSLAGEVDRSPVGKGKAVDISEGGICLVTAEEMSENQILRIHIPMPGVQVQTPTLAMVRWSRPFEDGYKVGMMFVI